MNRWINVIATTLLFMCWDALLCQTEEMSVIFMQSHTWIQIIVLISCIGRPSRNVRYPLEEQTFISHNDKKSPSELDVDRSGIR